MLLLISYVIVAFYTMVFCIKGAKNVRYISAVFSKCIAMSIGMISGTAIGLFIGIQLQGELAFSTLLAIFVSAIIAIFTGRIFNITGIIEALASSFMGAMMGAMLGEMLAPTEQTFMIIAMNVMYSLVMTILLYMMHAEHQKTIKSSKVIVAPLFLMLFLTFSSISVAAMVEQDSINPSPVSTDPKEINSLVNEHHHH
nr:hypothetical protein [Lysinibacillus timonensis]